MEKLLKPPMFDTDPESSSAEQDWNYWHKMFQHFTSLITDIDDSKKLMLLCAHVSSQVYSYISDCTTYGDAIGFLELTYKKVKEEMLPVKNEDNAHVKRPSCHHKYSHGYEKCPYKSVKLKKAVELYKKYDNIAKAAREAGVERNYLTRRLSGSIPMNRRNGPEPYFNEEEEMIMASWLIEMSERGLRLGPAEFIEKVSGCMAERKKDRSKDKQLSYKWYYGFVARNCSQLTNRKQVPMERKRAIVTPGDIDSWFMSYTEFLVNYDLMETPNRIFNIDESVFSIGRKPGDQVIGPQKLTPKQIPELGSSKEHITTMWVCNASGELFPPTILLKLPVPECCNSLDNSLIGTKVLSNTSGWMTNETFIEWLVEFSESTKEERPIALILDSVSSHVSLDSYLKAKELGIEIFKLPVNSTSFLQPLDTVIFGPLKGSWRKVLKEFCREYPNSSIGKHNFSTLLNDAYLEFYEPETIINAWESTGLYPVNRQKIS